MRVMKQIKNNYILLLTTCLPLLDILSYFFVDSKFSAITTISRFLIMAIIFINAYIYSKNKKKYYIFIFVLLLYESIHILSCYLNNYISFTTDLANQFRIMYMPVLLFSFIDLFHNKDVEKQITKGLKNALLIIAVSIILSLITNSCNYTYPNNVGITGWFYNKNSQSLILSIISFIVATYHIEKKEYYLIIPCIFLLLYFNATKAAYISLIILLLFLIFYLLSSKKIKKLIFTIIFLIMSITLFNYSPTNENLKAYNDAQNNSGNLKEEINEKNNEKQENNDEQLTEEEKMLNSYKSLYLNYSFSPIINRFSLEKVLDKYHYTKNTFILSNNRTKKKIVASLIYEEENFMSHLFGFEYTKIATIGGDKVTANYDLESDITALYYYEGLIGFILYFSFISYFVIKILKILFFNLEYIMNPTYMVWLLLIFLMIFGSEFSGDFLRRPNANIYLAFIIAMAYTKFMYIQSKENRTSFTNIFDKIYSDSKIKYLKILEKDLKNKNRKFIVTVNPETLMLSENDSELQDMLSDNDTSLTPDGIAIIKAARKLKINIKERITGIDIASYLLEEANSNKYSLYLFGAKEEVIKELQNKIEQKYPNIKLLGATNGYIDNKDEIMHNIINLEPDIVMLAMGIPLQEKLIYKHYKKAKKGIYIGVGGSFDVLSGTKKRAPKIFIKLNLEWLYRIVKEPKRLKRFYQNNIKFLLKIKK